jgi:hypothetical protein
MQATTDIAQSATTHADDHADQHTSKPSQFIAYRWPWEANEHDEADALYDLTIVVEAAIRAHKGIAHDFDLAVLHGRHGYLSRVRGQKLEAPGLRTFAGKHIGSSNLKTLLGNS